MHLLRDSLPVWVTQLAQLSYLRFDIVILGFVHVATREIGWYAAAWKIADVLSVVPALLSGAALPLISGGEQSSVPVIAPRYLKLMYVLPFLFALPLAIGAGWITRLFYGVSFTGTPEVLRILVWAVVPFLYTRSSRLWPWLSTARPKLQRLQLGFNSNCAGCADFGTQVRIRGNGCGEPSGEFAVCLCNRL